MKRRLGCISVLGKLGIEFQIIIFCLTKDENGTAISYDALLGAMLNDKKFKRYLHIKHILDNICTFLKAKENGYSYTNTMDSFEKISEFFRFWDLLLCQLEAIFDNDSNDSRQCRWAWAYNSDSNCENIRSWCPLICCA